MAAPREELERQLTSYPAAHAFLTWVARTLGDELLGPMQQRATRHGELFWRTLESSIRDMTALFQPQPGDAAPGDTPTARMEAMLAALHAQASKLPHKAVFTAFDEVLEAFYHPEVEAARTNMLKSCGLPTPAFLHLTCTSRAEAFTTQHERQEGIAVLWLDPFGVEITVSHGGHVVALTDFPAPHADPTPQLFEASAWLQREGWSPKRLPHGIRLLGRGLERAWLDRIRAKTPLTVTLPDAPEIDQSLAQDLLRNSMLGSRQLR